MSGAESTGLRRINRGRGHSYTLNGNKLDGVTTLIGDGLPKPALVNWAKKVTAEYAVDNWDDLAEQKPSARLAELVAAAYKDRDRAANRGTQVHAIAEDLVHGVQVAVPDEIAGHVESYTRFLDEWDVEPLAVEIVVANTEWHYAGTADLVGRLPNGRVFVWDLKTTRSGIFGETALQLCMYARCDIGVVDGQEVDLSAFGFDTRQAMAIHVRADGYDVHPLDIGDTTWTTARHVIRVARASRNLRDLVAAPLDPPTAKDAA